MKRLFASITVLTLILAACSHSGSDENEKNDDSSKKEQKRKSLKLIQRISLKIIKIKTVHLNLVVIIMNFRRLIHQLKILIHQNSNLNLTKIIVKIRTMLHLIKAITRHRSLEACLHLMEMKVKHYNNFQILKQP